MKPTPPTSLKFPEPDATLEWTLGSLALAAELGLRFAAAAHRQLMHQSDESSRFLGSRLLPVQEDER